MKTLGNHSYLVVEGINDGFFEKNSTINYTEIVEKNKKFLYFAHNFVPTTYNSIPCIGIETRCINPSQFVYETRTKIWMVAAKKVQNMLTNIENEKPSSGDVNRFGKDSLVPKIPVVNKLFKDKPDGDSCFTWISRHLETIDVKIDKSSVGCIATVPKLFTEPKSFYDSKSITQQF